MRLLCHRGAWRQPEEKNSLPALMQAVNAGFGVETDVRDCDGELVISHDPPRSVSGILTAERFLAAYRDSGRKPLLALNIKADGLQDQLHQLLVRYAIDNYFVFDMSIPDSLGYLRRDMPVARRISEYEKGADEPGDRRFMWLDAFEGDWYGIDQLVGWLEKGMQLCVVSPELHRRAHAGVWKLLRTIPARLGSSLYLCTDLFEQAREVFDVEAD